jgi:hypothetical protein
MVFLALSALFGIAILVEDAVLGSQAPPTRFLFLLATVWAPVPHVYALMGFIVVDVVLISLVARQGRGGATAAFGWGILQLLGMALDPLTGPAYFPNLPSNEAIASFATYLFGIWAFDARLVVQIPIAVFGFMARQQVGRPVAGSS